MSANTNKFIKENSVLSVLIIVLVIFLVWKFAPSRSNVSAKETEKASVYEPGIMPSQNITPTTPVKTTGIEWCVRLDGSEGSHVPHLLGQGEDNGRGGFNWLSQSNATGAEDAGILPNGTFFVKESVLKQAGMISTAELKADVFGWRAVPMVLATINGERAYVVQPK